MTPSPPAASLLMTSLTNTTTSSLTVRVMNIDDDDDDDDTVGVMLSTEARSVNTSEQPAVAPWRRPAIISTASQALMNRLLNSTVTLTLDRGAMVVRRPRGRMKCLASRPLTMAW